MRDIIESVETTDDADLRLIAALRSMVPMSMCLTGEPGLSLALGRRGQLIWKAAFGCSDIGRRTPMTPDHVFKLGSMSKPYVAVAIMQLVEQGLVDLEERADAYLPFTIENPLGARAVTVRDLLTHQSGLGLAASGDSQAEPPLPLADLVEAAYARPFQQSYEGSAMPTWIAQVGATWQYSNLGVGTLGLIVERAHGDGLTMQAFVEQRIMEPLGMASSNFPRVQDAAHLKPGVFSQLTPGYLRFGQTYLPTPACQIGFYPAGSAMGTPADHLRLLLAMLGGGELEGERILSEASVAEMVSKQRDALSGVEQGLMWRIRNLGLPTEQFDHHGAYPFGYQNGAMAWPRADLALVVSTNIWQLPTASGQLTRDFLQAFVGAWLVHEGSRAGAGIEAQDAEAASYVAGLVLVDALQGQGGVRTRLSPAALHALAARARFLPGLPTDSWDAAAFVRGYDALRDIPITPSALADFRDSGRLEVTPDQVRRLYRALGALADDFILAEAG